MPSDLRELYQQFILAHNRAPVNRGQLASHNRAAHGYNPLCGDEISVQLRVEDDTLAAVRFEGAGCAICTASASAMAERVEHMSVEEAEALVDAFALLVSGKQTQPEALGELQAFSSVAEFPSRIKCATLAWQTLRAALRHTSGPISTERS